MSKEKSPESDLSNSVLPITVDGPVYLTVEGETQELVVKCFTHVALNSNPLPIHIRFTTSAFGDLVAGILKLVEGGYVTIKPGAPKSVQ